LNAVRQYNTIYWRWSDNTIQYIEDGQSIQYIEDGRTIQCIEDGRTIQYNILKMVMTIKYNILKMVRQYNAIYWRWSDNTLQYIEDC
jgi:hypothetical protein